MSDNSLTCFVRTQKENWELLKFLVEESKKAEAPLNFQQLSRDFIEKSGSSRTVNAVCSKTRNLLLKIPKMENIGKETKVRIGHINEEYLNELRKDAVVVVDEKQRITKYIANDDSLKLEGDHTSSAKMKAGWETRRRRYEIPFDFQEEIKEDEDVGEDWIQDVGTCSQKNTIKRKVNTQSPNSTIKSMRMSSEREAKPEEEIVYEGPGEPPRPVQLPVKREPVEEPIALLDNKEQPKEKNPETLELFGNSGPLKLEEDVDFGISPEDAVDNFSTFLSTSSSMHVSQPSPDSTNITKFLELFRSLVGTLGSPKLCGLYESIDMKIRELGEQNLKAPGKFIPLSLESMILFITKNTASEYLEEDATSLKELLLIFRALTYNLTSLEFTEFQNALKDAIFQIGNQDKRVSYEKIQYGLEYAINFVLP